MRIAQIDQWEFAMPDAWALKDNDSPGSYFEGPDGTKGLYVKSIELPEPRSTPREVAEYIQGVHLRAFNDGTNNIWAVVDQRLRNEGELAHSATDIYDSKAHYRVLSLVVCNCQSAVQLTVHDYWCEQYSVSQGAFAQLESSIARVASAA